MIIISKKDRVRKREESWFLSQCQEKIGKNNYKAKDISEFSAKRFRMEEENQFHPREKELEFERREVVDEKVNLEASVLEVKAAPEVESYWSTKKKEFVEEMRRLLEAGIC